MKLARFIAKLYGHFLHGRFSSGFLTLSGALPAWLFCYDRACMMYTNSFKFPPQRDAEIQVVTADVLDIDEIVRVSCLSRDRIVSLLNSGVTCFLASAGDAPAASITWAASGPCYIRGLGFTYDFGPDGSYGFWSRTLPEARGQGLHYALMAEKARYEMQRGATKFYGLIEFANELSFDLRIRTGFEPILEVSFWRICGIRISYLKDLRTRKSSWKVFVREPREDITII